MPQAKLGFYTVNFDNSEEYHQLKNEIFTHDAYYFETDTPQPVIIDAGAHIGLATLYFKKIYPGAKVIAIEPNPVSFKLLEKNIWDNRLDDVEIHQLALSDKDGTHEFYSDGSEDRWFSTAGFYSGAWTGSQTSQSFMVSTKPLSDFLQSPVEVLKLDIEGAESLVLKAAAAQLHLVKQIMIEFHPMAHHSGKDLVDFLEKQGYDLEYWQKQKSVKSLPQFGLTMIHGRRN